MPNPNNPLWELFTGQMKDKPFDMFKQYTLQKRQQESQLPPAISSLPISGVSYDRPAPDMSNIDYNLNFPEQKKDPYAGLGAASAGLGAMATGIANIGRPDVPLNALGGALSGAGYGSILGPLGAGVGAVIGGLSGLIGGGLSKGNYEDQMREREKGKIKAATIYGTELGSYAMGGPVEGENNELEPIQTEKGEVIVLPDGSIFKSKATKLHSQMKKDFVTDILPGSAFVGSDKKYLTKKKADKISLGYDIIEYKEDGSGSKPTERFLGDYMSKNKMSVAEILNVVKNKFPTVDLKFDPFVRKANIANLKQRLPLINTIINNTKP